MAQREYLLVPSAPFFPNSTYLCRLLSFEEYLALAIEVRQENEELLGVEEVAWICFLLTFRWKLEQGGQL